MIAPHMVMLINIVDIIYQIYVVMIVIWILCSWIPELYGYRIIQMIGALTEPYLNLFRRIIPPLGMIDISPIVAIFCLGGIQWLLIKIIIALAL